MKKEEEILSKYSGYEVQELHERLTSPIIQPYDCFMSMIEFAELSKNDVIDSIIIDLTKRGFLLNPSKMKSQMLEVIRSHKNSDVESSTD